jgi:hypothetical protein
VRALKKTAEEQIKALFAKYSIPPLEVIIPILEKSGRGEQQLTAQVYDTTTGLAEGIKEILDLKDKSMKALAKVEGVLLGSYGMKFEPIELSESRFSYSVPDCPMVHVGKDVSSKVKSKFCDLCCAGASKALMDSIFGQGRVSCTWDKSLIKGARKCKVVYELVKTK